METKSTKKKNLKESEIECATVRANGVKGDADGTGDRTPCGSAGILNLAASQHWRPGSAQLVRAGALFDPITAANVISQETRRARVAL